MRRNPIETGEPKFSLAIQISTPVPPPQPFFFLSSSSIFIPFDLQLNVPFSFLQTPPSTSYILLLLVSHLVAGRPYLHSPSHQLFQVQQPTQQSCNSLSLLFCPLWLLPSLVLLPCPNVLMVRLPTLARLHDELREDFLSPFVVESGSASYLYFHKGTES